jgi:multisubunit Na+/H+ antiporter MnhE subunit
MVPVSLVVFLFLKKHFTPRSAHVGTGTGTGICLLVVPWLWPVPDPAPEFSRSTVFFIYILLHLWHAFKAYTRAFVVLSHSKKYGSGNLMRCYQQESELVYFWKNLWLAY